MTNKRYELRYLPLFYDDLEEKVLHIAKKEVFVLWRYRKKKEEWK